MPKNQQQFGNRHVIITLKNYLNQQDQELYKPLTKAIYDLSLTPSNCVILHDVGISSVRENFIEIFILPIDRIYLN